MTIVKEVIDGLEAIANAIKNVKEIGAAVKEGRDYLAKNHPEAKADMALMVAELRKSMELVADASAVLTRFQFALSSDVRGRELVRFNEYFIHHNAQAEFLRSHLDDLRGHCAKIREHAAKIEKAATVAGFARIFAMLGLMSPQREADLAEKLDKLAYEDFNVANSAKRMLDCVQSALRHVQSALGVGGMLPENVPSAAALLGEYARAFEPLERSARAAADATREAAEAIK